MGFLGWFQAMLSQWELNWKVAFGVVQSHVKSMGFLGWFQAMLSQWEMNWHVIPVQGMIENGLEKSLFM